MTILIFTANLPPAASKLTEELRQWERIFRCTRRWKRARPSLAIASLLSVQSLADGAGFDE